MTHKACSGCGAMVEVDPLFPAEGTVYCGACIDAQPLLRQLEAIERDWPDDG